MYTTIIETKFSVNDTAFVLYGNKVHKVIIVAINVALKRNGVNMTLGMPHKPVVVISSYSVKFESDSIREYSADEVFGTKEELLETL